MRKVFSLKDLHRLVRHFLSKLQTDNNKPKRGRPIKYQEDIIITLFLYQRLFDLSFREILQIAKQQKFPTPSLRDYHYRVQKLSEELLQMLVEEVGKFLLSIQEQKNKTKRLIVDATGFGFGKKYPLNWQRGTEVKMVSSHVRLALLTAVDSKGKAIIIGCQVGRAYASEVQMLEKMLDRIVSLPKVPFVADKGYDAVRIIQRVIQLGCEPVIGIKQTFRMGVKDPLRKMSLDNWERYGRERYRIEGVFGSIKQKLGSSFRAIREDISMKMALACALLWNFYMLVVWFYFLFYFMGL